MNTRAILLLLVLPAMAFSQQKNSFAFPDKVGDFMLRNFTTRHLQHYDDKTRVHYTNMQAVYFDGETDSLWVFVSRFDDKSHATTMVANMQKNVKMEMAGYSNFQQKKLHGLPLNAAKANNLSHYFFQSGRDIFWLTGDEKQMDNFVHQFLAATGLVEMKL